MNNVIVSHKSWNRNLDQSLELKTGSHFHFIERKEDLTFETLKKINPKYVFFPHWSYIIPLKIHSQFECVIFHMTDLPYGRGGSPLQNLIVRGHQETQLSAIRCVSELDAGPIYLKEPLSLLGSAEEIFMRASVLIEQMIFRIIKEAPEPKEQIGEITLFKRRKPEQGNWSDSTSLTEVYDKIRMLDAAGYPPAFIKVGNFKLEFTRALRRTGSVIADVKITQEMGSI